MGCLVALILIVLVLGAGMWATVGLVALIATLVVAGLVGWAADLVVPGRLPGGWLGAVLTGLIGGWLGHLVFNALNIHVAPLVLFGVDLIPAFVGALIVALVAELFTMRRPVV
jgi:uncharacterized membrane protein YeaQ/YmgE (transglycosylase-associated protein family)